jgi:hypothetical protein
MKAKLFQWLEIDHVKFMLWRLFQIRAEESCGGRGAGAYPSNRRTTSCKFTKERMLQRQA